MIIRTQDLVKIYKRRKAVNNVSIHVLEGEIVGLLGPNGAGKTTTFYMIAGLIKPNKGKIFLGKTNITSKQMYKRARLGIGYLPQETTVFRKLTVYENLLAPLEFRKLKPNERKERVEELLESFGITRVRNSLGYNLSGGERRRVEIARALTTKPKFMLLDEPFAGIDPMAVEEIQGIITQLKKQGIGILITDHNVHETLSITSRSYLIYGGRILKEGTPEELSNDEEARKLYLGETFSLNR